jgi:hypothetical protein
VTYVNPGRTHVDCAWTSRPTSYRSCLKQYANTRTAKWHDNVLLLLTQGPNRTLAERAVRRHDCIIQQTWRGCDIKHTGIMNLTYMAIVTMQNTQSFHLQHQQTLPLFTKGIHRFSMTLRTKQQLHLSTALIGWSSKSKVTNRILHIFYLHYSYLHLYIYVLLFNLYIYHLPSTVLYFKWIWPFVTRSPWWWPHVMAETSSSNVYIWHNALSWK